MLFDGEMEIVQGLDSRRVYCDCAANLMTLAKARMTASGGQADIRQNGDVG
jgi:hypothetical protein